MINIVIAYDDNDSELGDYFEISHNDIRDSLLGVNNIQIKSIRGLSCSEESVLNEISSFEEESFGFVGLSHGNESQLLTDNDVYVDSENILHFKSSLFYSTACSTALELGGKLIDNGGCYAYVGFNQDSAATYDEYYNIYVECENYCLKEFFATDKTIKQTFDGMLAYFDNQILTLLEQNDDEILVAMELIGNKDSFVLLGNEGLTKHDLG